jgi:hypothetical protein
MNSVYNSVKLTGPQPMPGMPCTIIHYSDRSPATVIRVSSSGKTCWIRPCKAVRTDNNGMSEMQQYDYHEVPEAKLIRVFKRKCGQWFTTGGEKVGLGRREKYHDFSF